ncbi:MAG: LysM peptidoglycan-binding domain-containing protein [Verrucomicrobiales bacterium]|nr:LysM peptidoglycan-binding domain-containing protein [Verrucomicrobiales bacterium]
MARVRLLLAFFALCILAAGAFGVAWYWKNFLRANWEATREIEGRGNPKTKRELPDLGIREFEAAQALLIDGEWAAARDRLHYLMEYYPDSKAYNEAKHIVGEINMDLLLSPTPIPGKEEHLVKSGDLLAPLARRYQTTINYMMRAGGRLNHLIYPGDRLIVYPLNFRLRISLGKQTVTVLTPDDGKFFKDYEIRSVNLPPALKPPVSAKIAEMVAWHEGRAVTFESPNYFDADKWIRADKVGLFIRAQPEEAASTDQASAEKGGASDPSGGLGVKVDRADLEEMFAFLRASNAIELVP